MLVLAPHQDDEAIGCGGALALQIRSGAAAHVIVLQDGGDEHLSVGVSREELTLRRNRESIDAAAVLGLPSPQFLNHESLKKSHNQAVEQVRNAIRDRKVDAVFAPFIFDNHPDHLATNRILADALESIPWDVRVFGYEVWGLCIPNVIVAIDEAVDQKRRMIESFPFANAAVDYTHSTLGLNMYRSRLLPPGTASYAECFFEIPKDEFCALAGNEKK